MFFIVGHRTSPPTGLSDIMMRIVMSLPVHRTTYTYAMVADLNEAKQILSYVLQMDLGEPWAWTIQTKPGDKSFNFGAYARGTVAPSGVLLE